MRLPKEFEHYLEKMIIKKHTPDKPRADFLIKEAETSLKGLEQRIKIIPINELNANSIIKECYDIIMELIRAKLLLDGYSASGSYAHEGEISYLKKLRFTDNEISFLNEMRYFRNSITYYGKILDKEYAQKAYSFLLKIIPNLRNAGMQDFEKHKKTFNNFLDKIGKDEKVGILSHANCIDGMASAAFLIEILKKKNSTAKTDLHFVAYANGALDKFHEVFEKQSIRKVFVLDFNADIDMFDEFDRFRSKFDVCFIDHHPMHPQLKQEQVIKTHKDDCTALVMYQFGKGVMDYSKWSWLVCAASVSEFSWKTPENLKFIQSYYPNYKPGDEGSDLLKIVNKMGSLVTYYSKDSLKAYELIEKKDFKRIDEIHKEVWAEMERCLDDFEKNAEPHFDKRFYFYFFKSRFALGSKLSTIVSIRHLGSTIVTFSEISGTDMLKMSARNNTEKLPYLMNEMFQYAVKDMPGAMGAGHPNAAGGSFLAKDLDKIKQRIKEFVKSKLH